MYINTIFSNMNFYGLFIFQNEVIKIENGHTWLTMSPPGLNKN